MNDTPKDKLAANSQDSKGMGGGANHPFEAYRERLEAYATGDYEYLKTEGEHRSADFRDSMNQQAPSALLNEPPGIQANREQMGYGGLAYTCPRCGTPNDDNWPISVGSMVSEGGCQECWEGHEPKQYVGDTPVVGFKGQAIEGRIIVLKASLYEREQEELRLLRVIGALASQVKEANLGIWQGPFEELESACYDLEVFHNPNPFHSGAVELPEAEGRV